MITLGTGNLEPRVFPARSAVRSQEQPLTEPGRLWARARDAPDCSPDSDQVEGKEYGGSDGSLVVYTMYRYLFVVKVRSKCEGV